MGYEEVKKAFAQTLEKLGTDYLDMYPDSLAASKSRI